MNIKYVSLLCICLFLSVACQNEEAWSESVPPVSSDDSLVSLQFQFTSQPSTRATIPIQDDIVSEESQVNSLIYAIFQKGVCRKIEEINFAAGEIQTGANGRYYILPNIEKKWLDQSTEIYAVANAPTELRNSLMKGEYVIPDDYPLLQLMVREEIIARAKAKTYDKLLNDIYNYSGGSIPKWQERYYFPPSKNNKINNVTYDNKYRCSSFADFEKRLKNPNNTPEEKKTYEMIWEDLQCRFVLFRQNDYNTHKNNLTHQENTDHAIRQSFQADPNLQKYLLWRSKEWEADLNKEARQNASKWIEQPVMAGCRLLNEEFPATIVVPVERIYNRIWFHFHWDAHKETEQIVVDTIIVKGLMNRTRLFNLSKDPMSNNPSSFVKVDQSLFNEPSGSQPVNERLQPFFPNLDATSYPYHIGTAGPQMLLDHQAHTHRSTPLWVYQRTATGEIDSTKEPHRCYVYSYQLGGNSMEDNPIIEVNYHFTKKEADGTQTPVYKKASARLYDETHNPGKRHHGLLRNYTYQLNCKVTSLSNTLDIQIVAVPWYTIKIDDIPPFE